MHLSTRIMVIVIIVTALVRFSDSNPLPPDPPTTQAGQKQLYAVRGEVKKVTIPGKGMVSITMKPFKDYAEVTVAARENDLVGAAVRREGGPDLFGALAGDDSREDDGLTAAELREGDLLSIIYDPLQQNRALEIYLH